MYSLVFDDSEELRPMWGGVVGEPMRITLKENFKPLAVYAACNHKILNALSRVLIEDLEDDKLLDIVMIHVSTVKSVREDLMLVKLQDQAQDDGDYKDLITAITNNFTKSSMRSAYIRQFFKLQFELFVDNGLVLRGCQIVIPPPAIKDIQAILLEPLSAALGPSQLEHVAMAANFPMLGQPQQNMSGTTWCPIDEGNHQIQRCPKGLAMFRTERFHACHKMGICA
eukprot:TCALIF_05605-PA protein Name:"Protein of unknown function" AED:0.38 eAED:0.39 QI:0/0/0/0.33/1/1/3/0/225